MVKNELPRLDAAELYVRRKRAFLDNVNMQSPLIRALLRGTAGAGLGAAAGGLGASALNYGLDEDDDRRLSPLGAALKGALFGGALNAGGGALYDRYQNMPQSTQPPAIPQTREAPVFPRMHSIVAPPVSIGVDAADPRIQSAIGRITSMRDRAMKTLDEHGNAGADVKKQVSPINDFIDSLQPVNGPPMGTSGNNQSRDWSR